MSTVYTNECILNVNRAIKHARKMLQGENKFDYSINYDSRIKT